MPLHTRTVPCRYGHGATSGIAVDGHVSFKELLAECQRDGFTQSFETENLQRISAQCGKQAARFETLQQQIEIGLVMLENPLEQRSVGFGLNRHTEIAHEFP